MRREEVWDKVYDQVDDRIGVLHEECWKRRHSRVSFVRRDFGYDFDEAIGELMNNIVINLDSHCRKKLKNIK